MLQNLKDKRSNSEREENLKVLHTRLWGFVVKFLIISFIVVAPCIMICLWFPSKAVTHFFANLLEDFILPTFNIMFVLAVMAAFYVGIRASNATNRKKYDKCNIILARNIFEMNNLKYKKLQYANKAITNRLSNPQSQSYQSGYDTNTTTFMQRRVGLRHDRDFYYHNPLKASLYSMHYNNYSTSITNPGSTTGYMGYSSYSSYLWNSK